MLHSPAASRPSTSRRVTTAPGRWEAGRRGVPRALTTRKRPCTLLVVALFDFMMRFGSSAHMVHGHGGDHGCARGPRRTCRTSGRRLRRRPGVRDGGGVRPGVPQDACGPWLPVLLAELSRYVRSKSRPVCVGRGRHAMKPGLSLSAFGRAHKRVPRDHVRAVRGIRSRVPGGVSKLENLTPRIRPESAGRSFCSVSCRAEAMVGMSP